MSNKRNMSKRTMFIKNPSSSKSSLDTIERLNVRLPVRMLAMMDNAVAAKEMSRNKWVSEAVVTFKRINIDERLAELGDRDPATQLLEVQKVHQCFARRLLETKIETAGAASRSIRLLDNARMPAQSDFQALLDIIKSVDQTNWVSGEDIKPEIISLEPVQDKIKTILTHMIIWEALIREVDLSNVLGTH